MISGKSIYHVDQGLGQVIDKGGYYNDLTQKVLLGQDTLNDSGIPEMIDKNGSHIQMPTMIFQYGLGAYDLWLLTSEQHYLDKAIKCSDWAVLHQLYNGAWDNFSFIYPNYPYSAMSQGEGISLLLRTWKATSNERYIESARKAFLFLTTSVEDKGVMILNGNEVLFKEYVQKPTILNGWVFSLFGLYDYSLYESNHMVNQLWNKSIDTLVNHLSIYDNDYWTMYNEDGLIASPFYHKLHVAQMEALYILTHRKVFKEYGLKWKKEQKNIFFYCMAFIKKAVQKIIEKE